MKCENAEKLILLQDSGEMADKFSGALAAHLHDCDPCRQFQHAMHESTEQFLSRDEPSPKVLQDVLREARMNVPRKKPVMVWALRPAIAMAATLLIALGLFFTAFGPDKVGLELVMSETQLLDSDDQVVSVMYDGLSEDDLAFNFLMTFGES